ncbi:MAG TPA: hypothetical protein VJU15_03880 [Gemmatimonadales bacterium]|nr:hypothetical protein [Gemmatimonadales bacterium]
MNLRSTAVTAVTALIACAEKPAPAPEPAPPPPAPADSLVLEIPGGITVWFTQSRTAKDSTGKECHERALEVRQDSTKRGVGLFYTREAPTLLGKDAMRGVLYNNCIPGPAYRIDFATLSPKRIGK